MIVQQRFLSRFQNREQDFGRLAVLAVDNQVVALV
jgi:hypothetical protein